jgi:hydroxymethylbilane synthase
VPTIFPPGLGLRCITEREDPRDILILAPGITSFMDLPHGARIGTSSLRRKSQLLHLLLILSWSISVAMSRRACAN